MQLNANTNSWDTHPVSIRLFPSLGKHRQKCALTKYATDSSPKRLPHRNVRREIVDRMHSRHVRAPFYALLNRAPFMMISCQEGGGLTTTRPSSFVLAVVVVSRPRKRRRTWRATTRRDADRRDAAYRRRTHFPPSAPRGTVIRYPSTPPGLAPFKTDCLLIADQRRFRPCIFYILGTLKRCYQDLKAQRVTD